MFMTFVLCKHNSVAKCIEAQRDNMKRSHLFCANVLKLA